MGMSGSKMSAVQRAARLPPRQVILAKTQGDAAKRELTGLKKMYAALRQRDRRIDAVNARANVAERASAAKQSRMEAVFSLEQQKEAELRRRYAQLYTDAAALKAYATKRMRDLKLAAAGVRAKMSRFQKWKAFATRQYRRELQRGARAKLIGRMANYEGSNVESAARSVREGIAPVRQQL